MLQFQLELVEGETVCDLEYVEDSAAETDMNVVMMEDGRMIEVQGTAEGEPFSHEELLTLFRLSKTRLSNKSSLHNVKH